MRELELPLTPMGSSVEVFDTSSLDHVSSHSLGMRDEGSLTWTDRFGGGWIAGFAHYDGNGGVAFKDHTYSSVLTFDAEWRRTGGWLFPQSTIERMAPGAASGARSVPTASSISSVTTARKCTSSPARRWGRRWSTSRPSSSRSKGRLFLAHDGTRTVFAIDRRKSLVRTIAIPPVTPAEAATALRFR